MNGREWIGSLGGRSVAVPKVQQVPEPSWLDVLIWVQETHPGKGKATRYLADRFGVDIRSAQRWMKLDSQPGYRRELRAEAAAMRDELRHANQAEANRAHAEAVADARRANRGRRARSVARLREIEEVNPGKVTVVNKSDGKPAGTRTIGWVPVDLEPVADLWEEGRESEEDAEDELSDTILNSYGDGLGDVLLITEYPGAMGARP